MENEVKVPSTCSWKNVVSRIGTSVALFGVIMAIMFVFLIGFTINNEGLLGVVGSVSDVDIDSSVWIYDYFGKVYIQIDEIVNSMSSNMSWDLYSFVEPAFYIPTIICTIAAAGVIVTVLTLGIMSIVKLTRKLIGKETRDGEKFAFATMLTYFLGSAALKVFNHVSIDVYAVSYSTSTGLDTMNVNVSLTYNPATIAGIVICAVALGAFLACRIAEKGAELNNCKAILRTVFTVVSIALAGVVAHFAACSTFAVVGSTSGMQMYIAMPTTTLMQTYAYALGLTTEAFDKVFFMFMLMMILQLAVLALAFTSIITQINNMLKNKEDDSFMLSVTLAAACVVYLVLAIVTISEAIQGEGNAINATIVPCIVALMLATLNLCTSVVRKLMKKTAPVIEANEAAEKEANA